jgi:hypothetical protein
MIIRYLIPFLSVLTPVILTAQGSTLPFGSTNYHLLDRLEILSGMQPGFHSSLKGHLRGDAVRYGLRLDTAAVVLSYRDKQDIDRIFKDNNEWLGAMDATQTLGGRKEGTFEKVKGDTLYRLIPSSQVRASLQDKYYFKTEKPIWGVAYRTPANFLELNEPFFHLRINPLINFSVAAPGGDGDGKPLFVNQRGVEIRGGFDDRIFFYSNITDTQGRFPEYVREYVNKNRALPGNGFYKGYDSRVFDSAGSYDWLNGQAYIGFNVTRHVGMQFGHGRHFIGNGYRSMLLSDFSHNYLYLKVNWRVWRLHYQNLFTELQATSAQANPGDDYIPRKYMAAHYLSFEATKNLTFGLYEATVFQRENAGDDFELQYLNPVILYRSVEHLLDSEDNVLVGLDVKWNLLKRIRLYGQLIMDEYKFSELTGGRGWWANKWGIQAGGQYINAFGVDHLDLRVEFNTARPYTYTHRDSLGASYSHYNQALAHPLGANFKEYIGMFRYQPFQKWTLEGRLIRAEYGEDEPGKNWGGNILLDYANKVQDYDNFIGQGISTTTTLLGLDLSYELYHNIFLDFHYFYRKKDSALAERNATNSYLGLGFRMNTGFMRMDF